MQFYLKLRKYDCIFYLSFLFYKTRFIAIVKNTVFASHYKNIFSKIFKIQNNGETESRSPAKFGTRKREETFFQKNCHVLNFFLSNLELSNFTNTLGIGDLIYKI